jgi:hypothetical protein
MAKKAAKAKRAAPAKRANTAVRKIGGKTVRKTASKPVAKAPAGRAGADAVTAAIASLTGAISADQLDQFSPELIQKLIAAAVRAYSAKVQAGEPFLPFHPTAGRVSPTDVMITASSLLKAADLQVFELGMWQSYTGR